MLLVRKPAVAGQFYPSDPEELSGLIDSCYTHPLGPGRMPPSAGTRAKLVAVVAPHAGYVYSGPVAAHSYLHVSSMSKPELLVVVAPDHYGVGTGVSTFKEGEWVTPLGRMKVDQEASKELVGSADVITVDPAAHRLEHSLEVQLPFLQRLYGDAVPFLPISMTFQDSDTASMVADAVCRVVKGRRAVVVASSDLTHYEPAAESKAKDMSLIGEMLKMSLEGFYSTIDRLRITACGYGPMAAVMGVAKKTGLSRAELLKYASSGDTTGDNLQVVGYGALRFVSP